MKVGTSKQEVREDLKNIILDELKIKRLSVYQLARILGTNASVIGIATSKMPCIAEDDDAKLFIV